MRRTRGAYVLMGAFAALAAAALGAERFPPPDFGPEYVYPQSQMVPPRAQWWPWIDTAVLLIALGLASGIALKWRSRKAMVWLSLFSLGYFGFFRLGCVCSIGAVQNCSQGLCDPTYFLPWVVLAFFALPLLFSLLFGRVFCAGVCPLGALQDLVLLKPHRVPKGLDQSLSILRYFYLGLAVLLASVGATYIICQYDPFIAFFRLSARFHIWIWTGAMLVLAMFVGRPYCRYLCPYSVLLALFSKVSHKHATITPNDCVMCGLCHDSCPFGAIREAKQIAPGEGGGT